MCWRAQTALPKSALTFSAKYSRAVYAPVIPFGKDQTKISAKKTPSITARMI